MYTTEACWLNQISVLHWRQTGPSCKMTNRMSGVHKLLWTGLRACKQQNEWPIKRAHDISFIFLSCVTAKRVAQDGMEQTSHNITCFNNIWAKRRLQLAAKIQNHHFWTMFFSTLLCLLKENHSCTKLPCVAAKYTGFWKGSLITLEFAFLKQ